MIWAMPALTEPVIASERLRGLPQPTLRAEGLTVRPWAPDDARAVFEAYQDPAIQRWHVRSLIDLAEAMELIGSWQRRWQEATGCEWATVEDATLVGGVAIKRIDRWDGIVEPAYRVAPGARGRNTAGRAVSAVSRWAFEVLGLHRPELIHSTGNHASCRVAARAGLAPEGTMRGRGLHVDGWHDMHLHARLAD